MTLLFICTIVWAIFDIIAGIFTYKIYKLYKHLSMEINMGKIKKGFKKVKAGDSEGKQENIKDGDSLKKNEEFDGTFSNPFSDRETCYITSQSTHPYISSALDERITFQYVPDKDSTSNGDNINIPIKTDEEVIPGDEDSMLERLLYLSHFLNTKYKPSLCLKEEEWENMKWETINETYCLITVDLPRKHAELIRRYFRRLDTTYVKNDGTYYSKVTKGDLAKEVIENLIEVYPWEEMDKDRVKVNCSSEVSYKPTDESDSQIVFRGEPEDNLKHAIGNLCNSVNKLYGILSGK